MKCGEQLNLTNRLLSIVKMIDKCDKIADIGTDHAYIPIYCVENGICDFAMALDVNSGPLEIANKNIKKHNLDSKISTKLSNGFENYNKSDANCVIIAGMGGLLTIEIIKDGIEKIDNDTTLILQPMIAVYEVRKYLSENGFIIIDEELAKEEKKIYNIIKCKKGSETLTEKEMYVGKKLLENNNELLCEHMSNKIYTTKKIIDGLIKSNNNENELLHYKKVLSYYNEAKGEVL